MKTKIYFAHPVSTYGTILEDYFLERFSLNHLEIINPNQSIHQEGYRQEGMDYFKKLVQSCDKLYAIGFSDNNIGAGIAKEMNWMREKGGTVMFFPFFTEYQEMLVPCENQIKVLNVEETREKLKYKL